MTQRCGCYRPIPWYFQLARRRIAQGARGGYFLIRLARRLKLVDQYAWFPLGNGERILAPLNFPYIERDDFPAHYEPDAIAAFASAIAAFRRPAILLDCGADIGAFSRLVWLRTHNIAKIFAFEPNPRSFAILQQNLQELPVDAAPLQEGVGDREGFGELVSPPETSEDDAKYLRRTESGIRVRALDSLGILGGEPVALKLDVEGSELPALLGAENLLSVADGFVVQFEAHRRVAQATGIDPIECARLLSKIRGCTFSVFEENCRGAVAPLSLERGFFEQFPNREQQVLDVVASSLP